VGHDPAVTRFVIDPDVSQVWIEGSSSVHPIHATATGLAGWIELVRSRDGIAASPVTGHVRIAAGRLASGNALVDRETRRRIDVTSHPEITGTVTGTEAIASDRVMVTGEIAFRGEVRSVSGELVISFDEERLIVEGTQSFDVRDWGLRLPRFGPIRVHPDVRVRVHVSARELDRSP
jgi:polyisoprenoid-binding protein YceI